MRSLSATERQRGDPRANRAGRAVHIGTYTAGARDDGGAGRGENGEEERCPGGKRDSKVCAEGRPSGRAAAGHRGGRPEREAESRSCL